MRAGPGGPAARPWPGSAGFAETLVVLEVPAHDLLERLPQSVLGFPAQRPQLGDVGGHPGVVLVAGAVELLALDLDQLAAGWRTGEVAVDVLHEESQFPDRDVVGRVSDVEHL